MAGEHGENNGITTTAEIPADTKISSLDADGALPAASGKAGTTSPTTGSALPQTSPMPAPSNRSRESTVNLTTLKLGDTCNGDTIGNIFYVNSDFIVFTPKDEPYTIAFYAVNDACEGPLKKVRKDIVKLISLLKLNNDFESRIGYLAAIYAVVMGGDPDGAQEMIQALYRQSSLGERTRTSGKVSYLLFCLILTIISIIACLIIKYRVTGVIYAPMVMFILVATFGSIGGYISIAIKVSTTYYNFDKDLWLQILSACSRIFISMFSAVAIYAIIQSKLALGVFAEIHNNYLYYAFAILSGFSETFIPDVFNVLEKQTTDKLSNRAK